MTTSFPSSSLRAIGAAVSLTLLAGCAADSLSLAPGNSQNTATAPAETKKSDDFALASVLARVADTAAAAGNYATAARMYLRAHNLAPDNIAPALGLARASRAIGDHAAAADAYRAVLDTDRDNIVAHRELGRELMALSAPEKAIPHLEMAAVRNPHAEIHNELGMAYEMTARHVDAQDQFRAGLLIAPDDLPLSANLDRSLTFSDSVDEALEILGPVLADAAPTEERNQTPALAYTAPDAETPHALNNIEPAAQGPETPATQVAASAKAPVSLVVPSAPEEVSRTPEQAPVAPASAVAPLAAEPESAEDDARKTMIAPESRIEELPTDPEIMKLPVTAPAQVTPAVTAQPETQAETEIEAAVYTVQLGAFRAADGAKRAWALLTEAAPRAFDGLGHYVKTPQPGGLYRLRTETVTDRADATTLCADLAQRGMDCLVVETQPSTAVASRMASPAKPRQTVDAAQPMDAPDVGYRIQLAAFLSGARAALGWEILKNENPELLERLDVAVHQADIGDPRGDMFRLRTNAFADPDTASALCETLKSESVECYVVRTPIRTAATAGAPLSQG